MNSDFVFLPDRKKDFYLVFNKLLQLPIIWSAFIVERTFNLPAILFSEHPEKCCFFSLKIVGLFHFEDWPFSQTTRDLKKLEEQQTGTSLNVGLHCIQAGFGSTLVFFIFIIAERSSIVIFLSSGVAISVCVSLHVALEVNQENSWRHNNTLTKSHIFSANLWMFSGFSCIFCPNCF